MTDETPKPAEAGDLKITGVHRAPQGVVFLYDGLEPANERVIADDLQQKCFALTNAMEKHYGMLSSAEVSKSFGDVVDAAKRLGYTHALMGIGGK